MDQKTRTKTQMRSEYDGWVRLWETIYDCPWPGRERDGHPSDAKRMEIAERGFAQPVLPFLLHGPTRRRLGGGPSVADVSPRR